MAISQLNIVLEKFKETLDNDVKSLLNLHKKDSEKGAGRPGKWLDSIRRSAMVLLTANLENYIEILICEGFLLLAENQVKARKYPEAFRLWNFRQNVQMRNLSINDTKNVIDLSMRLWSDVRELSKDELKLEELKEEFANPTAKNVNWIMGLLNYENYLDNLIIQVFKKDVSAKSAMEEIATRRNKIAHGDTSEIPSIEDLDRLIKFSQLFANQFYKDVELKIEEYLK
jgi:hypothetical protein